MLWLTTLVTINVIDDDISLAKPFVSESIKQILKRASKVITEAETNKHGCCSLSSC